MFEREIERQETERRRNKANRLLDELQAESERLGLYPWQWPANYGGTD
jgi:hypothetical protein